MKMAGIRKQSVLALAVTMAAVFAGVCSAVDHTVGDATGWNIPPSSPSTFYSNWASRQTFRVGDVLVFNFTGHTVAEVSQASYRACSVSNPLSSPITTSPARITLNTAGTHYFLCTIQGHCSLGQRLAVTVTSASPAPAPQRTPSSSPAPRATPRPTTPPSSSPVPVPRPTASSPSAPPTPSASAPPTTSPSAPSPQSPTASTPPGNAPNAPSTPSDSGTPPPSGNFAAPSAAGVSILSLVSVAAAALLF